MSNARDRQWEIMVVENIQDLIGEMRQLYNEIDALKAKATVAISIEVIKYPEPCGFCGSLSGFHIGDSGYETCNNCGGV